MLPSLTSHSASTVRATCKGQDCVCTVCVKGIKMSSHASSYSNLPNSESEQDLHGLMSHKSPTACTSAELQES